VRILVLTNMFPPHSYGGYERLCHDVAERWSRAGHHVVVLTSDIRVPGAGSGDRPQMEVRRVLKLYWEDHRILRPGLWRRVRWERGNQRHLARALEDVQPDVASAWAMGAMSLSLLARLGERGVPVVSVLCDEWPVYGPHVDAWTRFAAARPGAARLVHKVTGVPARPADLDTLGPACFLSEALRQAARARSRWTFPLSAVVPAGIDPDDFPPAADAGSRPWSWRLLHVGRIDPRKGLHTVIEAAAACPPAATVALVGTGDESYLEELRRLVDRLGLGGRARFAAATRGELAGEYATADAVIFAPLWEEPFGLVPLEAMACGTPVVASPTGGAREFLVDGVNCLAFPPGDAGALRAALGRLAADAGLRRRLVEAGLRTAARFGIDAMARELELWHRRAVSSRPAPAR
jgi:glycogen(starch) synthase